ncbi:MAG: extracellular solute-binding protein, partial [Gammaproteobacteria bacterium]
MSRAITGRAIRRATACALAAAGICMHGTPAAAAQADIIHWWTSSSESAAARALAHAYRQAGGVWHESAIAGADQARAVAINRIIGGQAPLAAQFTTRHQIAEMADEGMLNDIDAVALRENWQALLPAPVLENIRVRGLFYAVPMDIHMQAWMWYSKAALRQAGVAREPQNIDELFAALDKLKAAGLIPLAHGGQPWQENILFLSMLANVGGADLYLRVLRDRDPQALASPAFGRVLAAFKRLRSYVDPGSPG